MNARTVLSLILLSLAAACGNKGPLVQAPVEVPVEPPVEAPPAGTLPADADSEGMTPESGEADDDEGPAAE